MAKDPRFNFYPDNWTGGTRRMTLEQKGAYLELLMLNFYSFSDGLDGFTEQEAFAQLVSAGVSAAACAGVWNFLKQKFDCKGDLYFSARLKKEFFKSKKSSEKQTERANARWEKEKEKREGKMPRHIPQDMPVNGYGIGNGIEEVKEEGTGETIRTDITIAHSRTCELFSISEQNNGRMFLAASRFIRMIADCGKLDYYLQQLENYHLYKKHSGETRCNIETWLHGGEHNINAGHWCREDYKSKGSSLNPVATGKPSVLNSLSKL